MTPRLKIIFAGSGEFGLPALGAIMGRGHEMVRVVSQPDRPAGRGRTMTPTPVASFAAERGLPLLKTADINGEPLPEADLMIVIAFGQKVDEATVHRPRLGSINLHASLLPKFRGAAPINWAIIRGESETGNSVIRLAARMDAGAVLMQSRLVIGELETAGELHDRLSIDGATIIPAAIEMLAGGGAVERPQEESQATMAPKLSRGESRLDFARPAVEIVRQIRGMYQWPGCRVRIVDSAGNEIGRATLVRARGHVGDVGAMKGTLDSEGMIAAGDGRIEIVEIQPEGKRPMALDAYRNGHRWEAGCRVESMG